MGEMGRVREETLLATLISRPLLSPTRGELALGWSRPHEGGEPISLYRLYARAQQAEPRWRLAYVGAHTEGIASQLRGGTAYDFKLQAHNANGWGLFSQSVSYTTTAPPLEHDAKPSRVVRVHAASVRCGGRIFSCGGQPVGAPAGVGGGRTYLGTLEEYDTHTRTWFERAPMTIARSHLALVCLGDRSLMAIGGYGDAGERPYKYQIAMKAAKPPPPLPHPLTPPLTPHRYPTP